MYTIKEIDSNYLTKAAELAKESLIDVPTARDNLVGIGSDLNRWVNIFNTRKVFGLFIDNKLQGVLSIEDYGNKVAYIGTVYVRLKRQGLGSKILEFVEDNLTSNYNKFIVTIESCNIASRMLFEKFGFVLQEERPSRTSPSFMVCVYNKCN